MAGKRFIGIKLIAFYFIAKSIALICAVVISYMNSSVRENANDFVFHLYPSLQHCEYLFRAIPLLAAFELMKGLGVWFLWRWVRALILVNGIYELAAAAIASVLLWKMDKKMLSSIGSSPYYPIGLVLSILILGYLFDPDVKRSFGVPEGQSW